MANEQPCKEEPLICPIKFLEPFEEGEKETIVLSCVQERCAWWSKYHEACAIHTINEIPPKVFDILSLLRKKGIDDEINNRFLAIEAVHGGIFSLSLEELKDKRDNCYEALETPISNNSKAQIKSDY